MEILGTPLPVVWMCLLSMVPITIVKKILEWINFSVFLQDDIGIGTVVGSAVFNIAFVIGICGVFAGCVSNFI